MKGKIIYVGGFKLPDLDAGAVRVNAVSDALRAAGYEVTLIGDDYEGPAGMDRTRPLRERLMTALTRALDQHLAGRKILRKVEAVDWRDVRAVIYYPGPAALLWQLIRICRRRCIRLIVDSTEWFDPTHVVFGRFGPFALDSELRMRWLHARAGNVICISSYLARHYSSQGCNIIRVPPLIGSGPELGPFGPRKRGVRGITLVYAGSPGRKELLQEICAGVAAARRKGIDVSFEIVGMSLAQLTSGAGRHGSTRAEFEGVVCHGRLPRSEAMRIVAASDYTVLLRPRQRFADAGFPSKLVESLSLGVPVLANETSDIAEYLRDGVDGFLLSAPTAAALEEAILRAAALSSEEREAMRANARSRARECFDFRRYIDMLDEFLSSARVCT